MSLRSQIKKNADLFWETIMGPKIEREPLKEWEKKPEASYLNMKKYRAKQKIKS